MHLLVHTYIAWAIEADDLLLYTPYNMGALPLS